MGYASASGAELQLQAAQKATTLGTLGTSIHHVVPRTTSPTVSSYKPHVTSGDRHHRADWMRRCTGLSGGCRGGDADGVIIVPAEMADEIAGEAVEMTAFEDFVTQRVRGGQKTLGLHPPSDEANLEAFADWRQQHGR